MNMVEQSDEELLDAILYDKDQNAFSDLVLRHSHRFYKLAWRMLSNDQDAEDVVQDAFVKLWRNPSAYNPDKGASFTTWFYKVVVNQCIDFRRRHKNIGHVDIDTVQLSDGTAADEVYESTEQSDYLEKAIQELPVRQKAALMLCFYEEMSNKEAAEILSVNVKALESLLMRAKSNLRSILKRNDILDKTG